MSIVRHVNRSVRNLCAAVALAALPGCNSAASVQLDSRVCEQSYEFGNTGCAAIEGRVVDADDRGLAGISVVTRQLPGQAIFATSVATTDTNGRFSLRITRMVGRSPATGPDTVSLWVRAADPRSAGVGVVATRRDSALVQVEMALIGQIPEPARVTIRILQP